MSERRRTRSEHPQEALQLLIEAVSERSELEAIALVDPAGRVVAGSGTPERLSSLSDLISPMVRGAGEVSRETWERATGDTDFFGRIVDTDLGTFVFAALGARVRRLPDAARAVRRICATERAAGVLG